jgi:hypothetical protein
MQSVTPARRKRDSEPIPGPPLRKRAGLNVNAWLPEEVVKAFHGLCEDENRGIAAQLEILLRESLEKRGRLAPKKK